MSKAYRKDSKAFKKVRNLKNSLSKSFEEICRKICKFKGISLKINYFKKI